MNASQLLDNADCPRLENSTLILAFSGWMNGGEVSTGTVLRLVELLEADEVGKIDPEPFYIMNVPGSMETAALYRPYVEYEEGLLTSIDMPENTFYGSESANMFMFVGKEPNMCWRTFGDCVLKFADDAGVKRILFVGSFGGSVPHTREPRLYMSCSDEELFEEMAVYGVRRRTEYSGPGSFTSYLLHRAPAIGLRMASLVAEIPGYLHGTNLTSIETVTRCLAKMFQLSLDLDSLRAAGTEWEMDVSSRIDEDEEMTAKIRQLEHDYDTELLEQSTEES